MGAIAGTKRFREALEIGIRGAKYYAVQQEERQAACPHERVQLCGFSCSSDEGLVVNMQCLVCHARITRDQIPFERYEPYHPLPSLTYRLREGASA